VAFLAAGSLGAAFVKLSENRTAENRHKAATEACVRQARLLEAEVNRAVSAVHPLGAVLRQAGNVKDFDRLAAEAMEASGPAATFALAPKGTVTQVYPRDAVAGLGGRDLLRDPNTAAAASLAVESRRLTLSRPLGLGRLGTAVVGLLPVFVPRGAGDRAFWGFVVVAIRVRELVRAGGLDSLLADGYHYRLAATDRITGRSAVIARSTEMELEAPVRAEISVPDGTWTLAVEPHRGWRSTSRLAAQVVLVLVAAFIVALSAYGLLKQPETLRHEVEVRARRLSDANRQLKDEIIHREQAEEQLRESATHDALTALPNRTAFSDRLQRALERSHRQPGAEFAVLFADVDRFKSVNESLGHAVGDTLLAAISRRLEGALRPGDLVARVGGDEFGLLLWNIADPASAVSAADRLLEGLKAPFPLEGREIRLTASVGIALSGPGYESQEELLRDAHTAMSRAKAHGRDRAVVFDKAMRVQAVARLQIETDLRRAIEGAQFQVHYQPIVSLASGAISGCEALVRWQHPDRGLLQPVEFLPLAEETGLITWIDRWVLREASRQARAWQSQFPSQPSFTLSVNLSGKQLAQPLLVDYVESTLREACFHAGDLKLEVTESVVMENAEAAVEILTALRALGVQLLIDDFGTGYSSLSYLHRFPFNVVKIDRSFVAVMHGIEKNREIVRTIIDLAHKLGMQVIAEGVETAEQLGALRTVECGYGQGYLFSQPLTAEDMADLLASKPSW
jgi:diguanylate cyclase (GGDEF)-like protein